VDGNSFSARRSAADPDRLQAAAEKVIRVCPHGKKSPDDCLPCRNHNSSFLQGWGAAMQECGWSDIQPSSSSSSIKPNVLHQADPAALAAIMSGMTAEERLVLSKPKYAALLSTAVTALLPDVIAAGCTAAPETWRVQTKFLFQPQLPKHQAKQQERQSLDRLTGTTRENGISLTIGDGRSFLLELTIIDSGADTAILTEATCKRYGIHVITTHVPQLLAIDGAPNSNIIGRTGPLVLTLAQGTPYSANLPLPNGALVMKGDAGGLYDLCLDKQTLHAVYGYVDPALSMLMFRPRPEQDMWLLNGIPITSAASPSRIKQLRSQGLLAPSAYSPHQATIQEEDEEDIACALVAGASAVGECCSSSSTADTLHPAPEPESEPAEPAASVPEAQPSPTSTAASSASTRHWATGILPGICSMFVLLLTLLAGCFARCVDEPLWCWPSRTFGKLLDAASTPIRSKPEPSEPSEPPEPQESRHKRSKSKAKSKPDDDTSKKRASLRIAFKPIVARLFLAFLLCMCSSTCSVAAMQFGNAAGSMAAGQSPAPVSYLLPDAAAHRAVTLLQHELTQLPSHCLSTAAAEESDIKWYKADPTSLDLLTPDGISEEPHDASWSIHPEGRWVLGNHPEATPEQMSSLVQMLQEEKGAFAYDLSDLPGYVGDPIHFQLQDPTKKMWCPPRQYTETELKFGEEKMTEMIKAGIVVEVPTTNRHASALTFPMKRAPDGSWTDLRMCIDLRHVNANTVADKYGMPLPEQLFKRIRGAKFLAKIDLRSGFWQLRLSEESQQHVAFWWRNRLYAYTRLPFGHVNATALFQRAMETELQASGVTSAAVFVDDVIVWADTFEEHVQQLRTLLRHFQKVGLRAHPAKTIVAAQTVGYLGHLISAAECRPEEAKLAGIKALQAPTSLKRLQAHLGLFNYYRCYVPEFSRLAQPLYRLLQKGAEYVWSNQCQAAYDELRRQLCKPGVALRQPVDGLPYHLYVDWSSTGIAAVLNQREANGNEFMIACASRSLNSAEQNYPAWKGEALAAVWGVKLFRPYVLAAEFFLHTDHRALLWLLTHKTPVGQQMRWVLALQEYRFTLVHKPGAANPADAPSREPAACLADTTGARLDYDLQDWPLPQVLLPDLTPDPCGYTHDLLTHELGITTKQQAKAQTAGSRLLAAQEANQEIPLALLLATEPNSETSPSQLRHDVLTCLLASNASAIDDVAPLPDSLLGGGTSLTFSLAAAQALDTQHPAVAWRQHDLQQAAASWVQLASQQPLATTTALPGSYQGQPDSAGIRPTQQLNTADCSATFFPVALASGVLLWEPFGGLCAGLEMAMRNGLTISRYIYGDIDPVAQRVAWHRIRQLQTLYPRQLPETALEGAFSTLPMDITNISTSQLSQLVADNPHQQWLVVGGWPCQDLSLAGPSHGMSGKRSRLLHELVQLLGTLQQLLPHQPPAFLLENVPFQHHNKQSIAVTDFQQVCGIIGQPTTIDAAQFGSLAHRARNYWTNLCAPDLLASALQHVHRPPNRTVQLLLQPHQVAQAVFRPDPTPQFPCNQPGEARQAWPTLMSRPNSYAFRPGQAGSLLDLSSTTPYYTEPSADQREAALGYLPGSTAAEGITEMQRRQVLGQCIDSNSAQAILAISKGWWLRHRPDLQPEHEACIARALLTSHAGAGMTTRQANNKTTSSGATGTDTAARRPAAAGGAGSRGLQPASAQQSSSSQADWSVVANPPKASSSAQPSQEQAADAVAELLDSQGARGSADIWTDHPVLQFLRYGNTTANQQGEVNSRVRRRASNYYFRGQQLIRRMPKGELLIVPSPDQRNDLILRVHNSTGHFGIRRTAQLVRQQYWWHGYWTDVANAVRRCESCNRVNASFGAKPDALQSIPVSSAGFRWHVDLCGPMPKSQTGNRYVMVAVEAFTKHIEAVPIPDKEASTVAYHFLHNVLARFGAPGQVVTDNGSEFDGAFAMLLRDSHVDHCRSSPAHPQANGQAEKAVGIIKRAITKTCTAKQQLHNWDREVGWAVMGYRCSKQRSTGLSPYEMLYARAPVIPSALQESFAEPIDLDNDDAAVRDLLLRQRLVAEMTPMALQNLSIAQHRDQLRYAKVRAPDYKPRQHTFKPGQYAYVQQLQRQSGLQPRAQPVIYRVAEVRDSGVLLLQGKCGRTTAAHVSHCSPCHLPDIDGSIDPRLAENVEEAVCEVCGTDDNPAVLLLCDVCTQAFHIYCLQPPLDSIPSAEHWLCPVCMSEGYTVADAQRRETERQQLQELEELPNLFPDRAMRGRDEAAAALHGRLICKPFLVPVTLLQELFWGRLHYRGPTLRPTYFLVMYQDGDSETMTMRQAKKWLQPAGTQLPSGVVIPDLGQVVAAAASVSAGEMQELVSYSPDGRYPAVNVPDDDLAILSLHLQISAAQHVADPITNGQQWRRLAASKHKPYIKSRDEPALAALYCICPTFLHTYRAIQAGMQHRPALLVCYVASVVMPAAVDRLVRAGRCLRSAACFRANHGWWLLFASPPMDIDEWLN
jgi:site-specific DNA-cytosine methylase/transposase-like protein